MTTDLQQECKGRVRCSAWLAGQPLTLLTGDCRNVLKLMPDESVNCCVTSPPYWGLRDYGVKGHLGLESTLEEYLSNMVTVFEEVRRVLRSDGTLWMNMGDSYNVATNKGRRYSATNNKNHGYWSKAHDDVRCNVPGLKPKDMVGQPWMLAFALRAAGWYLRADIIWHKPNAMPESVTDRPTKAHEYLFLLSKSGRYHYDADAIKEGTTGNASARGDGVNPKAKTPGTNSRIHQDRDPSHSPVRKSRQNESFSAAVNGLVDVRNKRSVWSIPTAPYRDAHFATYPPDLIKPCVLAGCPVGGLVLDPFAGSGTTGMVALELGRRAVLIELNADYVKLCAERCAITQGLPLAC